MIRSIMTKTEHDAKAGYLSRVLWTGIRASGYVIERVWDAPNIFHARREDDGSEFLFAIRIKGEPTFRRVTGEWEYGIDVPDWLAYEQMRKAHPEMLFLLFFPTVSDTSMWFGGYEVINKNKRHWKDDKKFPIGIYFIRREFLQKVEGVE